MPAKKIYDRAELDTSLTKFRSADIRFKNFMQRKKNWKRAIGLVRKHMNKHATMDITKVNPLVDRRLKADISELLALEDEMHEWELENKEHWRKAVKYEANVRKFFKKKKVIRRLPKMPTKSSLNPLNAETYLRSHAAAKRSKGIAANNPAGIKAMAKAREKAKIKVAAEELERTKRIKSVVKDKIGSLDPAQQELLKREMRRRHLLPFIEQFVDGYQAGWAHRDVCRRLEKFYQDVKDGKSPRLMLQLSPRFGKSEIASKNFPAWILGKEPNWKLMLTSYGQELSDDFSREVRNKVSSKEYTAIFPDTMIPSDSRAIDAWHTTEGGGIIAAGVGGPINGKGCNILVVDDSVKNEEDASSKPKMKKANGWFGSTAYTRLAPGGGILIIGTRWTDIDIAGEQIRKMDEAVKAGEEFYDDWEVVNYEAIAETNQYYDIITKDIIRELPDGADPERYKLVRRIGEAIHPERFDLKALTRIKNQLTSRQWSALYQQRPVAEDGDYFRSGWFKFQAGPPGYAGFIKFQAWDLALSTAAQADYTVGVTCALDFNGNVHVIGMRRAKMTAGDISKAIVDEYINHGATRVGIERGATYLAVIDLVRAEAKRRGVSISIDEDLVATKDKEVRARPLQGMFQQGQIIFPDNKPGWLGVVMDEILRFGVGRNDDIVDALAWAAIMAQKMAAPRRPKHKQRTSWKSRLKTLGTGQNTGHHLLA